MFKTHRVFTYGGYCMYILTYYEPKDALIIEDELIKMAITSEITYTPVELLDVNCFYCKTSLRIETLNCEPAEIRRLPIANIYSYGNQSYAQIDLNLKSLEDVS